MSQISARIETEPRLTLTISRPTALVILTTLVASAVALPVASHWLGLPVRKFLPMHWPVIFAGLLYGWRGGAIVGLLSPVSSTMISGMPLPVILPSMTVELAVYGLATGFLRETLRWNAFLSVCVALIVGRVAFLSTVALSGAISGSMWNYVQSALTPGLLAATLQGILLPILAGWCVRRSS